MIYCETPTLEQWIAPPQEDLPRPTWTKLIADRFLISNSLEYADWHASPAQPLVCETCWNPGCSQAGLANIVRLGDQLLWLPPRMQANSPLSEVNFIAEPVLMPVVTWAKLRETISNLPAATTFARATLGDLAPLWLHEIPRNGKIRKIEDIASWLRSALASDPLDLDVAKLTVAALVDWICSNHEQTAEGRILRQAACGNAVNTFYFDGYEWPSYLDGNAHSFACGGEWIFVEGATS
ncbi:MAG: hypothetical protein HY289_11935 [Planctomycetes bacterium]|nr:hypothetical protein [Planctomycetota bacterium]